MVGVDRIDTERCVLDRPAPGDRDDIIRLRTDAAVRRYLGGPSRYLESKLRLLTDPEQKHYWAVRMKDDGRFIGLASLYPYGDTDTELSYEFLPEFWGQGLASESLDALIACARADPDVVRVVAMTQAANQASRRLLDRLGMTLVDELVRYGADQVVYAIPKSARPNE